MKDLPVHQVSLDEVDGLEAQTTHRPRPRAGQTIGFQMSRALKPEEEPAAQTVKPAAQTVKPAACVTTGTGTETDLPSGV